MADPFSIIGVLAVAMNGIERATKFIEGISGAPRAIERLESELKAIGQLLHQVHTFVHDIHVADSSAQDSFIPHLQTALANCRNVASDVETLLRPYVKATADAGRSTWRRFVWSFKEQKTAGLEKDMATCKQTLNMAISFADLYVDAPSTQNSRPLTGTRAVNSKSSRRVMKIERGVKQIQMNLGIDNVSVVDSDYAGSVDTAFRRNIMTSQWIMQSSTVVEETTEELHQKEHFDSSHEDDVFFDASNGEALIEIAIPPSPQKTVEPARKRSNWSTAWTQRLNTTQTQPPVAQKTAESARKKFQWKSALMPDGNAIQTRPPAPQPPAPPTTSGGGQRIRKTVVSREALQALKIKFSEEGEYVRLPDRIEAETLQLLRGTSRELCKNSKLWWADPPNKPAIVGRGQMLSSQVVSSHRVAYSNRAPNDGVRKVHMLRKTIVSRSALQKMGISYLEDTKHVFLSQELDAATVRSLRDLSMELSPKPRGWWT
jgi:hypothetical protein